MKTHILFKSASFAALALAGAVTANLLVPAPARADDCLLDRDNDGAVDAGTDNDGGAASNDLDTSLACGIGATTGTAGNATAIGVSANASGGSGATAVGRGATATGNESTAIGENSSAGGVASAAFGEDATATAEIATAVGSNAGASGRGSVTVGSFADASAAGAIAIGGDSLGFTAAQATGVSAIAIGDRSSVAGTDAIGIGRQVSVGSFLGAVAVGASATAGGTNAIAMGTAAQATGLRSIAIGGDGVDGDVLGARASNQDAVALGADAVASNFEATALGGRSLASGGNSFAAGAGAQAVGQASLAFGSNAVSSAVDSTAIGGAALAQGDASTAVGRGAAATTSNATALGRSAVAAHVNATAIGAGAQATAANQIRLGTTSNIYSLPGLLTASDAAQTGPEFFVTIDSNGTLGKGAQSSAALSQMGSQIAALQQGQALIDDQVASLFNLRTLDRKQNQRGIAAAMAMADAPFPSAPGKTSYAAKTGVYRGEVAVSASFSHRLNTGSPFALTASVSHSGGKDTGFTAGLAGEF